MNGVRVDLMSGREDREEILRNLNTLLGIRAGTQPVDRELGISWECLDLAPEAAEAVLMVELEQKIRKYEPRAELMEAEMERLDDGTLQVHVHCAGREEE